MSARFLHHLLNVRQFSWYVDLDTLYIESVAITLLSQATPARTRKKKRFASRI